MKTRWIALPILGFLVAATSISAYVLNGPKWGTDQVPYYINPVNADMSEADAIAAVQAGALNWTAQSNAAISMYYMGRTSGSSLIKNNKNEVFFRASSAGSMAAEVYWWYDSSYRLIEADMVFYDGGFKFFPGGSGCSGGVYLEDIATHEFGHVLGLGHSSVSAASMYPKVSWCSTATRSLDGDDLAGIEKLYPAGAANTAPTVTISSPSNGATFADGVSVTFSGSATDKEDGTLAASLVWESNLDGQIGTGANFARVLSAGSHTITARVTDSDGVASESIRSITVESAADSPEPPATGFTLTGSAYKVKGAQKVDLKWSGSTAGYLDVYRDGVRVAITANDGAYTDPINKKGGGSYTYVVCAEATSTCSNQIVIRF
jgi:hypothetical protein